MKKIKELLSQKEVQQFLRFCIVGGTCAMIDAAVFYVVRLFAPYQVALISGYLISFCVNYFLRMGLMWLFVEAFGLDDSVAYIPMAIISAVTNFIVIRAVVKFSKKKKNN